jgi:pyruvate/2-oxoglutarate dehydrogenase complex dihydrolipoamide dehydrogenase (E3) component
MKQLIHYDLAIIGAGSGGLSLAAGAAQLGLKVVLVEKGLMGGDCLNYGCIPSKSLLAAAKANWQANHSENLGVPASNNSIHFKKVIQHLKQVIETLAVHDSVKRFEGLGVKVIQAAGQFIDQTTLRAGTHEIKAKNFVIATGSSATIPPIPGLDQINFYTNETLFNITDLPPQLIIIGGGPIGCELAQAFAMLGSKVTLIEGASILGNDDPEAVEIVRQSLIKTDIFLNEHLTINQISSDHNGNIIIQGERNDKKINLTGTHLFIATGRKPNIEKLNCQQAGIKFNKKGIIVNQRLRTSNKKIYAIGDAAGKLQFTHVANDHAGVVLRNIAFKLPAKVKETAIPWVIFTEPELAHVGKSEAFCTTTNIAHTVLKMDYTNNDRAQTDQQTTGFIKVIANPQGKILGVTIVGHQAGELVFPWVMAIREGKKLRSFTDTIVAYPTLSELSKRVASQFYTPKLFSRKVKKLVQFLSYF